ncbi:hypothetical protein [Saccharomonospora sp. CUA-673]|uniref:hypothetical protein n=1 Tax=Saccharomonospora sp. CUA-673 TaxID=1904969 RepID=UPI00210088BB|nr:hypothetical protein [Saccharomonospora sp. CUA-673]
MAGLRHLGGAFARPPRHPSAVEHREAEYVASVLSPVRPTSDATDAEARAVHDKVLAPFAPDVLGACLPFSFGPSTPAEVRSAFTPATAGRLCRLRHRVDPHSVIRPNHVLT